MLSPLRNCWLHFSKFCRTVFLQVHDLTGVFIPVFHRRNEILCTLKLSTSCFVVWMISTYLPHTLLVSFSCMEQALGYFFLTLAMQFVSQTRKFIITAIHVCSFSKSLPYIHIIHSLCFCSFSYLLLHGTLMSKLKSIFFVSYTTIIITSQWTAFILLFYQSFWWPLVDWHLHYYRSSQMHLHLMVPLFP